MSDRIGRHDAVHVSTAIDECLAALGVDPAPKEIEPDSQEGSADE